MNLIFVLFFFLREERSSNTLYQELSFQEASILEDSSEITGNWVNPGEFASSGIFLIFN